MTSAYMPIGSSFLFKAPRCKKEKSSASRGMMPERWQLNSIAIAYSSWFSSSQGAIAFRMDGMLDDTLDDIIRIT